MDCEIGTDAEAKRLVTAALTGQLTDAQSDALAELSPEILGLALLAASKRIAEQDGRIAELEPQLKIAAAGDPATPSGQKPVYVKPPTPKSRRRPGAKKGHAPARRKTPQDNRGRCPVSGEGGQDGRFLRRPEGTMQDQPRQGWPVGGRVLVGCVPAA